MKIKYTIGKHVLKFGGKKIVCDIIGLSPISGFYKISFINQNQDCVNGLHIMEVPSVMLEELGEMK